MTTSQYGVLAEVARAAGVSQGTVSKVVHGKRDVGEATRLRVQALLDEAGYRRPGQEPLSARIYGIFRDLDSPYTLAIARSIVEAASEQGVEVVVGTTKHQPISHWLRACGEPGSLGMVLVISMMSDADQQRVRDNHVPVVLLDPLADPMPGVVSLGVTNWQGGYDAVTHLIDQGHRRIGVVSGRPHSPAGAARLHGYRAALLEAQLAFDEDLVCTTDFDYDDGIAAGLRLLRLTRPPSAIFATSDSQALGVLEAARRLGVAVPHALSVMSFDDTPAALTASPPLSAVGQPFDELGAVAVRILTDLSRDIAVPDRLELATNLTLRHSTASSTSVSTAQPDGGPTRPGSSSTRSSAASRM